MLVRAAHGSFVFVANEMNEETANAHVVFRLGAHAVLIHLTKWEGEKKSLSSNLLVSDNWW